MVAKLGFGPFRIEPAEYFGQCFVWYARSGVFDHDQHAVRTLTGPDPDRIAITAKRDRVGDQVHEHLRQPRFKPVDKDRFAGQVCDEVYALGFRIFGQILGKGCASS